MTSDEVTRAVATVLDDVSHHGAVDAVQALGVECSRAHRVEWEQAQQLQQKDETIKALADALTAVRDGFAVPIRIGGSFGLLGLTVMDKVEAALRIAGRLP